MVKRFMDWVLRKKMYDFYLAGSMRGYPNGNKEMFLKAAKWLRLQGFTVWNPAEQNDGNKNFHDCIKKDLTAIIYQCNGIALLSGWRDSLGANTEALTAHVCGRPAVEISNKDEFFYMSGISLESIMVLPFNPSKNEFRKRTEMIVAENEIFNPTQ